MSRFRVIPRAATRLTRQQMYDIIRVAGDHREGDRRIGAQPGDLPGAADATKREVKAAVEGLFEVKVTRSTRSGSMGKLKRFRGRLGRRSDYKKAIVTLAEGSADRRDDRHMTAGI